MQIQDADLKLLRIFDTIVHCGGFSAAQTTLNLTTSTISEHMSQLEARLGVRLCDRGRGGFKLTEEGIEMHAAAQRMLTAIDTFRLEAASVRHNLGGTLHFGVIDATVTDEASPLISAIQRLGTIAPEAHLHIHIDTPHALEQRVLDGRLHLAVGPFLERVSGLDYSFVYREHHGLYCSRTHPLQVLKDEQITPHVISQAKLAARAYLGNFDLDQLGVSEPAGSVDNVEARALMILSGHYIGFLPLHYAKAWEVEGALKRIRPDVYSAHLDFHLLMRNGPNVPRIVRALRDQLIQDSEN